MKRILSLLFILPFFAVAQQSTLPSGAIIKAAPSWYYGTDQRAIPYFNGKYYPLVTLQDTTSLVATHGWAIPNTQKGAANGVATLDDSGKLTFSQVPAALLGAINYQGAYDASTNTPALPSATTDKGYYWVVSVAGTQFGLSLNVNDWIVSNGSIYQKVDNNNNVTSVFGRTGLVTAQSGDYSSFYYPITGNPSGFLTTIAGIAAGGDLSGTYPNPTVATINGITKSYYDVTSSIQTQLNGKQAAGSYITALTGDGSASGPGSAAFTLATVNSNVGSFGGASSVPTFTVNAKGLVTAASNTAIQIAESQVTNLTTDLAAKQAQLSGTGFVKVSGTTVSYDNSTYLTGITGSQVTTALGYTPYNSSNPAGYISSYTETDPTVPAYAKSLTAFSVIKASTDTLYLPLHSTADNSSAWVGQVYNGGAGNANQAYIMGYNSVAGQWGAFDVSHIQSFLGLGSNAYTSTAYLPLTGGTLTGNLYLAYSTGDNTIILKNTAGNANGTIRWQSSTGTLQAGIASNYNVSDTTGNLEFLVGTSTKAVLTSAGSFFIGYTADPTSGNKFAVNGNSYFNGTVTASGLTASKVVFTDASKNLTSTGIGTSSQFLMADGSVNSNIFLTTTSASSTYVPYTGATADLNLGSHLLTAASVTTGAILATSGYNNSQIALNSTGTVISRNIADANAALIVAQNNASSTGSLLDLQFNGLSVAHFDVDGTLVTNANVHASGSIISSNDMTAAQYFLSSLNTAPSSSSDTGTAGEIRFTSDYIYLCISTNSWKRVAFTTF